MLLFLFSAFLASNCLASVKYDTRFNWNTYCQHPQGPRDLKKLVSYMKQKNIHKGLIGEYDLAIRNGDELKLVPYQGKDKFPILCPRLLKNAQPRKTEVKVNIVSEDITDLGDDYDTIVNAANEGCLGGSGVDGAIHKAAGKNLVKACSNLPIVDGKDQRYHKKCRCPTGEARITKGYDLCPLVIHAVGPRYEEYTPYEAKNQLMFTVLTTLILANRFNSKRIAIPAIAMNSFKFPKRAGAEIICGAIKFYLDKNPFNRFRRISIVLHPTSKDHKELKRHFNRALELTKLNLEVNL